MQHVLQHLHDLQRELTYLVEEGVNDPALGPVVDALPQLNSLQLSVDRMRYFLWCLTEFVPDEDDLAYGQQSSILSEGRGSLPRDLGSLSDAELLTLFCDSKARKPN